MTPPITVLGAGAWGTALAISAARQGVPVHLWARDAAQAAEMRQARRNARYLPDAPFPDALQVTADFAQAVAHAHSQQGLIIIGTPMAALAEVLQRLPADAAALWLCKGFEKGTGRLGHEIARAVSPQARTGVLSGPSFAHEVAIGRPTALVAASPDASLGELAVRTFHSDSLRVYTSPDPVGVEVGGAVKNVLAIATGIADGLELGLNARAALITRGLAEMTRLGVALGARAQGHAQAGHLGQATRDEGGAGVQAQLQPVGDAGGDRQHVLDRAADLDAHRVGRGVDAQRIGVEGAHGQLAQRSVGAGGDQRGRAADGHFVREARTGEHPGACLRAHGPRDFVPQPTGAFLEALAQPQRGGVSRQALQHFGQRRHGRADDDEALLRMRVRHGLSEIGRDLQGIREGGVGQVARVAARLPHLGRLGGVAGPQVHRHALARRADGQRGAPGAGPQDRDRWGHPLRRWPAGQRLVAAATRTWPGS